MNFTARACALGLLACFGLAQNTSLMDVLSLELKRNYETLRSKGDPAPYFLSYGSSSKKRAALQRRWAIYRGAVAARTVCSMPP